MGETEGGRGRERERPKKSDETLADSPSQAVSVQERGGKGNKMLSVTGVNG